MRLYLVLGFIAITASASAQWTLQTSNTTADLRGIHNVGNGVAWASGTNGTILRTEDGGYVWQSCSIPPGAEKLDFRGIQAFDANTAIVMSSGPGDQSRLYKTTDGCHSWKLIFTNPDKGGFWDTILLNRFDKDRRCCWVILSIDNSLSGKPPMRGVIGPARNRGPSSSQGRRCFRGQQLSFIAG